MVRIDASPALALPGVEAVYTAADIPGDLRVGIIHKDWPVMNPEGGRTSYLGDVLAIVVAVDRPTARAAAELIDVEYVVLTPFADTTSALADGADDAVWELPGNVLSTSVYARGDAETALAESAHVVRQTFQTQRIEHAFLEPESTLAVPGPEGLHVYSGGQGIWDDRDQIAALLGLLDRLAEQAGISGWEIRDRNVITPGDVWGPGQLMDDGCKGARSCLDAVRPAVDRAVAEGHAVGVGLGLKNSGLGNGFHEVAKAVVRFDDGGGVEVRHGWTQMGQGIHTVALQVACTEFGVAPERVTVLVDTSRELGKGQTTGSRGTLMGAGSVQDACRNAIAAGCTPNVDHEGIYEIDWTNKLGDDVEHPLIHSTFGYAAQVVVLDRESGNVIRVIAAHDVGKAVNPLLVQGQIEGAVHMGLGYALSEDFPTDDDARPTVNTLRGLNIIRPKDMPPVEVVLIEEPSRTAPMASRAWARSAWCPPPVRWPLPCTTRTASGATGSP